MGQGRYEMQKNNDNKDILIWDNKTDECLCCIAQIEAKLNLQDYIIKELLYYIQKVIVMSEQFTIVGEEYVGYMQGNAYIISDEKCKFSLWERKEDTQKVCDYLNKQQATINELKKEIKRLKCMNNQLERRLDYSIAYDMGECE